MREFGASLVRPGDRSMAMLVVLGGGGRSRRGSVVETTRQESQVILRMTTVMPRPIRGSARGNPMATRAALATTASETNPSTRAWLPSAINAGLCSRRPARSLTWAAISLPTKPITPAAAVPKGGSGSGGEAAAGSTRRTRRRRRRR